MQVAARRGFSWCRICRRTISTTRQTPSSLYTYPSDARCPSATTSPSDLSLAQREILDSALRVDQAGEVTANWIYRGQIAILARDPSAGPLIQDMWNQEKKHLAVMDKLLLQHRSRPTALTDVAKVAGLGLGIFTALMGKEAAMACTEAVETVIGEHYDDQLKELELLSSTHASVSLLKDVVREFRDDELEHLNTAVEHFAQRAPAHAFLSTLIGAGCKVAIEVCKRI